MKSTTLKEAEAHAISEYPRESCGLVVTSKRKEFYVRCTNVADDPKNDFSIGRSEWRAAEEQGKIKMVVHSHPDANCRPSPSDMLGIENSDLPWLILAVHGDPATPESAPVVVSNGIYEPTGYEMPYRGRTFKFGSVDCYTLVQDFYKRDMGIELPDFERKDRFWERGEDLYMENFAACGFDVIPEPSQKGDLILMAIRSEIVNHAAIWLGEMDHMLHHPYNHLSERVVFGGYWLDNTRVFIRKVR